MTQLDSNFDALAAGESGAPEIVEAALAAAVSAKLVTNGNTHDHNGGDGAPILKGSLLLSASTQSASTNIHLTKAGGNVSFYPQLKSGNSQSFSVTIMDSNDPGGSCVAIMYISSIGWPGTAYLCDSYISSSPPYKIGNATWGHFLFLLRNKSDGKIIASSEAPDPPWHNNGKVWLPKDHPGRIKAVPHPFADYWNKDPAVDGLEICMVDLRSYDVEKWKADNFKIGKLIIEDMSGKIQPNKIINPSALGLPTIAGFTDIVKIREHI